MFMTRLNPQTLEELEERLAEDLLWLNRPASSWVEPREHQGQKVLDVAVIGAGLCGLIAMAALKGHCIENVRAFDRAPAGQEGPWITYARMETLRTSKVLPGLALGLPALTFRAWYEAQFGREAFEAMSLIPTAQWMDYLIWYRRVLELDVVNEASVQGITPRADGLFEIAYADPQGDHVEYARRVIIATGLDGLGEPFLPAVAHRVPEKYRAHGAAIINMSMLKGKTVAVIGSGSSAMDNAAAALEAGAARVDVFARQSSLAKVDRLAGISGMGTRYGYFDLPDADKWLIMHEASKVGTPPPKHSVLRVSKWPNAHFHLSSPIDDIVETAAGVEITTPKGLYGVDFIIFATGFGIDYAKRPEFEAITSNALLWGEAYTPPEALGNAGLAASPYLGAAFQFMPKSDAEQDRWISHAYCFSFPSLLSHGKINSGIPSINEGATTLSNGVARSLFVEDREQLLAQFHSYDKSELTGDEWTDADETANEHRRAIK
jgi:cation diffusion facilitator CzcD-associated flavoprotein CzcO